MTVMGIRKGMIAAALGLSLALSAPAMAATPLQVPLDQARPLVLKAPATGVVIGNPSIAGVTLQTDQLLFVTGKSYGTTNLIIVGENGRPVYEGIVTVVADESIDSTLTLTRGLSTVRQSCTPVCRKTPDLADDAAEFDRAQAQARAHAAGAKE
jgi:Flp pilus assembly secretin CpaC